MISQGSVIQSQEVSFFARSKPITLHSCSTSIVLTSNLSFRVTCCLHFGLSKFSFSHLITSIMVAEGFLSLSIMSKKDWYCFFYRNTKGTFDHPRIYCIDNTLSKGKVIRLLERLKPSINCM